MTSGGVARTEWAGFEQRRRVLDSPMCSQFLWASGALGGDDDPFLGKEILW
jgi:hypothetical protein